MRIDRSSSPADRTPRARATTSASFLAPVVREADREPDARHPARAAIAVREQRAVESERQIVVAVRVRPERPRQLDAGAPGHAMTNAVADAEDRLHRLLHDRRARLL